MKGAPTIKATTRILVNRVDPHVLSSVSRNPSMEARSHAVPVKRPKGCLLSVRSGAAPSCDTWIGLSDRSLTPRSALKGSGQLPPRESDEAS